MSDGFVWNECRNMGCPKESGYLITWPDGRAVETCSAHVRWAIDMALSSSPGHAGDFHIKRRKPPARPHRGGRIRMAVSLVVDKEWWRKTYGPNGTVEDDVKSRILTLLQADYDGSEELWKDVDVK